MRIRTISQAHREIKDADPETAITEYRIRQLVVDGVIPSTKSGAKYLIDMDKLQEYFTTGLRKTR